MDELIKLLDEYDNPLEHVIINGVVMRRVKGTNLSTGEKYEPTSVWRGNKSFGFIKWLIENDKIDLYKAGIDELPALNGWNYDSIESKADRLTMILSIKDKPVDFIVSILKEDNEKVVNEAKAIKVMEGLLNELIEKGWRPFGMGCIEAKLNYEGITRVEFSDGLCYFRRSLRELVSKESGLWQFCVENKLVKEDDGHITMIINVYKDYGTIVDGGWDYHYWLMICSILDDSELEEFLIDNIKI